MLYEYMDKDQGKFSQGIQRNKLRQLIKTTLQPLHTTLFPNIIHENFLVQIKTGTEQTLINNMENFQENILA